MKEAKSNDRLWEDYVNFLNGQINFMRNMSASKERIITYKEKVIEEQKKEIKYLKLPWWKRLRAKPPKQMSGVDAANILFSAEQKKELFDNKEPPCTE